MRKKHQTCFTTSIRFQILLSLIAAHLHFAQCEFFSVDNYTDCFVLDPTPLGNGVCDNFAPYNTPECGEDGKDCTAFNAKYKGCKAPITDQVGDGKCQNYAPFNTTECMLDGGDCEDFILMYPNCHVADVGLIGDGECQDFEPYNTPQCMFDGGDCGVDRSGDGSSTVIKTRSDRSGRYIGIGTGCILGVVVVVAAITCCWKRRNRRVTDSPTTISTRPSCCKTLYNFVAPYLCFCCLCCRRKPTIRDSTDPPPKMRDEAEEDQIGLALAGGGIRAATSCYSILRGFQQKRIIKDDNEISAMEMVKYNSGISGGSIPAVLYTYAGVSTEELLETDRTTDPSKITDDELSRMPDTSMGFVLAKKPNTCRIICMSVLKIMLEILRDPRNIFKIHAIWTRGLFKKMFEPLNVERNKFFTSSKEEMKKIILNNPHLKETDFLLPREDVKTLPMILFTMHGGRADMNAFEKKYSELYDEAFYEFKSQEAKSSQRPKMTEIILSIRDKYKYGSNIPMPYVATPDCVENKYSGIVRIWNKMIAFPEKNVRPVEWGVKNGRFGRRSRFSIELLTSMSTNAAAMTGTKTAKVRCNPCKSRYNLAITALRRISLSDDSELTLRFGDGGTNDLFGIIPLVDHGTKNIITVYNYNKSTEEYCTTQTPYADIYEAAPCTSMEDPDFDSRFETWLKHMNPTFTCYFGYFGNTIPQANILNHIFHDPSLEHLKRLMITYNSLYEAGEPLIATMKDLEVIGNPFWGIKGGNTVNLTMMWFNMPKKFSELVPEDAVPSGKGQPQVDNQGRFTCEEFRDVPELSGDLNFSHRQINMMGYLGSWMVNHSWDGLKGLSGELLFEGFAEIFEKNRFLA